MWEFTITLEPLYGVMGGYYHQRRNIYSQTYSNNCINGGYLSISGHGGSHPNHLHNSSSVYNNNNNTYGRNNGVSTAMQAQIKKIARNHIGRDGRTGAIYERGGMESISEDPLLREHMSDGGIDDGGGGGDGGEGGEGEQGGGKWRIPLGAYYALITYLTSSIGQRGIPTEQLRMASLGRERMDKKVHATVNELLVRGVAPSVARSLAPYQRSGVEFILDRDGRALLADKMGLRKTIQAIAAMSAYAKEDWPLLVLCPSTARYHWEVEFRHWLGAGTSARLAEEGAPAATTGYGGGRRWEGDEEYDVGGEGDRNEGVDANANPSPPLPTTTGPTTVLQNGQINVLTSGRGEILKRDGSTRVVICSIGLLVNLASSNRICAGMFRAIVVDKSHAFKNRDAKRTKIVLPLLKTARRCLLLSGTPAFAKPSELWPQLSALGSTSSGIWCDEDEFMSKYATRGEEGNKARLAELHTLLTSTVMIRRMKADILKNLPSKIREKAYIQIEDENLRYEFVTYMQLLRQGKGVLGKLARLHHKENTPLGKCGPFVDEDDKNNQ